jgi:hypothetical protein
MSLVEWTGTYLNGRIRDFGERITLTLHIRNEVARSECKFLYGIRITGKSAK